MATWSDDLNLSRFSFTILPKYIAKYSLIKKWYYTIL